MRDGEGEGDRGGDTAAGGGGREEVRGMGEEEGEIRQLEGEEERR